MKPPASASSRICNTTEKRTPTTAEGRRGSSRTKSISSVRCTSWPLVTARMNSASRMGAN